LAQQSRYGDVLRVLCDPKGQAVTLLTSRDRLCEPSITVTHYRLPGLGIETWRDFFAQTAIEITETTLTAMHRAYGGNAKAMTILRGAIQGDFDGEGDAYWQENSTDPLLALDLKNLVASQVNRLKDLDPEAYRLFCRLGSYRYQDVPRLPTAGVLALMWDVDSARHRQVIMSLRNRSLLESHRGHYWLHPVVQAEALNRLRPTIDWPLAHHQAAQFWTESVTTLTTVTEATHALEAYYHCWAIADYAGAAAVLLHSYHNQWGQYLTLGSALYRIGLLQPLRTAITALLPHLPEDQRASELRNILADVHWISGQVHDAIALQEQARAIALRCLQALPEDQRQSHSAYCLTMVQVDALLSLGLYHLDLWNLDKAAAIFQQVIDIATGTAHQSWADKATLGWALVQSYGTDPTLQTQALTAAEQAYQALTSQARPEDTGRFAFFMQLLGQIYANGGRFANAEALYTQAIAFAKTSHYRQVQAKALVGQGELARQRQDWAGAITALQTALGLFEDLGARSDLAEAHYQCGLTHQVQGAIEMAQTHFQRAIQLFTVIQAPKQIAKVEAAQLL
jgi:tetratricopeptide (TPR) repeat protein